MIVGVHPEGVAIVDDGGAVVIGTLLVDPTLDETAVAVAEPTLSVEETAAVVAGVDVGTELELEESTEVDELAKIEAVALPLEAEAEDEISDGTPELATAVADDDGTIVVLELADNVSEEEALEKVLEPATLEAELETAAPLSVTVKSPTSRPPVDCLRRNLKRCAAVAQVTLSCSVGEVLPLETYDPEICVQVAGMLLPLVATICVPRSISTWHLSPVASDRIHTLTVYWSPFRSVVDALTLSDAAEVSVRVSLR